MIGEGAMIEGTVQVKGDIHIGGIVKGEIEVDGKLITTKEGRIEGDAITNQADIAGKVKGSIIAKDRLILRSTSVVQGDVRTPKMAIEDGAVFTGKADMSPTSAKKPTPQSPDLAAKPVSTAARPVDTKSPSQKELPV
jgi:cytoskeletal protein CcmA (bactofilin family)